MGCFTCSVKGHNRSESKGVTPRGHECEGGFVFVFEKKEQQLCFLTIVYVSIKISSSKIFYLTRSGFCPQVFIHLSTAFCHVDKEILEEKVYDSPYDPHDIMRIVKWMDLKSLNTITPK